jgi:hypothetical protein
MAKLIEKQRKSVHDKSLDYRRTSTECREFWRYDFRATPSSCACFLVRSLTARNWRTSG